MRSSRTIRRSRSDSAVIGRSQRTYADVGHVGPRDPLEPVAMALAATLVANRTRTRRSASRRRGRAPR